MSIEQTKDEIIIRIAKKRNARDLQEAINYLTYKSFSGKSKATQKDIDDLVASIKKDRRPYIDALKKKCGLL